MTRSDSVGQFEQLVLTAVLTLYEEAYGVTIHAKVQELSRPKSVTLGAVYVTLDRMEDKGYISSWLTEPTAERGGRAKRAIDWRRWASERWKNRQPRRSAYGTRSLKCGARSGVRRSASDLEELGVRRRCRSLPR